MRDDACEPITRRSARSIVISSKRAQASLKSAAGSRRRRSCARTRAVSWAVVTGLIR